MRWNATLRVFDASSMIYAWDNYPITQFPSLWKWIASQIEQQQLTMPVVAFDEVAHKAPDCGAWLKQQDIELISISNAILQDAVRIKSLIGIVNDNFHPKGVGENDILIIAAAKVEGADLVSDEERQIVSPVEPRKRKIPAVCGLPQVGVPCLASTSLNTSGVLGWSSVSRVPITLGMILFKRQPKYDHINKLTY